MEVKFKKLHENAVIPTKAHDSDAGFDLTCVAFEEDPVKEIVTYHTGIAMEIPEGYVGLVFPKRNICKFQLSLADSITTVRSCDKDEVKLVFRIVKPHIRRYGIGDVVAELRIVEAPDFFFVETN